MKKITMAAAALALLSLMSAAAEHRYIEFSKAGHMVIAGPFNAVVPIPRDARVGETEHTTERFLSETLKVSKAEYVEAYNVQIVPAVRAVQLSVTSDDGTGEGNIIYMHNVPEGCDAMTPEFEAEYDAAFGRFIESIQGRN